MDATTVSQQFEPMVRSYFEAERVRKDAAAEKASQVECMKSKAMALYREDATVPLPTGIEVQDETDCVIDSDKLAFVSRQLLDLSQYIPALSECVEIKLNTKKLADILTAGQVDGAINPFLQYLPIKLETSPKVSISGSKLVDPGKKDAAIAWAKGLVKEDSQAVALKVETTKLNGEPVSVAIVPFDDSPSWHTYIKPEKSITTEASLAHGIDDAIVKDAPPIEDVWSEITSRLDGKQVVMYSTHCQTVLDKVCEAGDLPCIAGAEWHDLMGYYADWKRKDTGKFWKWDEVVQAEHLAITMAETEFDKPSAMIRVVRMMAGNPPSQSPPASQGETSTTSPEAVVEEEIIPMVDDELYEQTQAKQAQAKGDSADKVDDVPF